MVQKSPLSEWETTSARIIETLAKNDIALYVPSYLCFDSSIDPLPCQPSTISSSQNTYMWGQLLPAERYRQAIPRHQILFCKRRQGEHNLTLHRGSGCS